MSDQVFVVGGYAILMLQVLLVITAVLVSAPDDSQRPAKAVLHLLIALWVFQALYR